MCGLEKTRETRPAFCFHRTVGNSAPRFKAQVHLLVHPGPSSITKRVRGNPAHHILIDGGTLQVGGGGQGGDKGGKCYKMCS
jgi:hypothetical protein